MNVEGEVSARWSFRVQHVSSKDAPSEALKSVRAATDQFWRRQQCASAWNKTHDLEWWHRFLKVAAFPCMYFLQWEFLFWSAFGAAYVVFLCVCACVSIICGKACVPGRYVFALWKFSPAPALLNSHLCVLIIILELNTARGLRRQWEMTSERKPRLCLMAKGENGYGFHLHGEKGKSGQYIRKVEPGSPAEASGLRAGDRVVAVNGVNVEKETHHQASRCAVIFVLSPSVTGRALVACAVSHQQVTLVGARILTQWDSFTNNQASQAAHTSLLSYYCETFHVKPSVTCLCHSCTFQSHDAFHVTKLLWKEGMHW